MQPSNQRSFIPYSHQSIDEKDIQAVAAALSKDIITRGETVEAFEKAIASYCGATYAVAFNSGSTALTAACHAAQVGPYDRIITTPNTFIATVNAGMRYGATPIFIDIDTDTGNLNLDDLEVTLKNQQSSRGKNIIIPVHFSGIPVDMERLESLIRSPDTIVIEDAAHALGSHYQDGQKVGCCAWSQMTMLSFHPAKTITTGEGGMVLTNDPDLYKRLQLFRNNGIERDLTCLEGPVEEFFEGYYEVKETTGNYNFTEFQAALGLSQLQRINPFIEKRRELMKTYRQLLQDTPGVKLFTDKMDASTAFHLCVAQIDFAEYNTSRAHVMASLKEKGIGTQMHYIPVYRHPFLKNGRELIPYFPKMEAYYAQAITLPLYYDLAVSDVERIVGALKEILSIERQKRYSRSKHSRHARR